MDLIECDEYACDYGDCQLEKLMRWGQENEKKREDKSSNEEKGRAQKGFLEIRVQGQV